ncbi:MFS transporter [Patescibacteria group bacterium]
MIWGDFLMVLSKGFLAPILAVYITTDIRGGSLATVGFATTIFWIVKSVIQIPVAMSADKTEGEADDFRMMMVGGVITAIVPLLYFFFASEVWHIYLFQALDGAGHALLVPTFLAIFTRHIDKHKESTEWTMHSNAVGIAFATAAAVGGVLAEQFGFRIIFLIVSVVYSFGVITLYMARDLIDGGKGGDGMTVRLHHTKTKALMQH